MLTHELGVSPVGVSVKVHDIPSDYGRVNPVNHIPALELDDGTLFYDGRVICEYLDVSHGARLLPREGAARWRTLKLQVMGGRAHECGDSQRWRTGEAIRAAVVAPSGGVRAFHEPDARRARSRGDLGRLRPRLSRFSVTESPVARQPSEARAMV